VGKVAGFSPRVNEDNPDPRIACALLLDTSSSMTGEPINELNRGFELFCDEIKKDELAQKRAEIAVITFGGVARLEIPFTEGRDLRPRQLSASGATPMGAALNLAVDQLETQKQAYRQAGLEYYRPWLFVLTDGEPTDRSEFTTAVARVRQMEAAKGVSVFPIGIGPNANLGRLKDLSAKRTPVMLNGLSFAEFFSWLSASLGAASQSQAFASSDAGVAQVETTEQIALPALSSWAQA
jgi:uncharacterized protein YegL